MGPGGVDPQDAYAGICIIAKSESCTLLEAADRFFNKLNNGAEGSNPGTGTKDEERTLVLPPSWPSPSTNGRTPSTEPWPGEGLA